MKYITTVLAAAGLVSSMQAQAVAVDLSGWAAEGGSSSWNVQPGNDSVLQTVNGAPTVFFDPSATSTQGTALSGNIQVAAEGDDDFIGFVLGYNSGEIYSSSADFYLIDWKQGDQAGWGQGLAISHVTDGSNGNTTGTSGSYWQHAPGEVNLITRASSLGNTGYIDLVDYAFNLIFTSDLIEVSVNGATEISITPADVPGVSSFSDGSFGFYNYSQAQVLYSAIRSTDCDQTPDAPECQSQQPVPEPATLLLIAAGFLGMATTGVKGIRR